MTPTKTDGPRTCDLGDQCLADEPHGRHPGRCRWPEVLVAEDDDDMRRLVVQALRDEGFHVVSARNGWGLLDQIGSRMLDRGGHPLDLIVTDVRMPGVTGLEILEGLRAHDSSTRVILMTAFADARLHAVANQLGVLAVLDKPFELDVLRELVRPLVHR